MSSTPPHLDVLTDWLTTAQDRQLLATQLHILANEQFQHRGLTRLTRGDLAGLMRLLGYTNKRTHAGMRWHKP